MRVGESISFDVIASDPEGDKIYYKFSLMGPNSFSNDFSNYRDMTGWIAESSWTWYPKDSDIGVCSVMVEVRDGHNALQNSWDDFMELEQISVEKKYVSSDRCEGEICSKSEALTMGDKGSKKRGSYKRPRNR